MAVNLSPLGGAATQFFDNNGSPLAGGYVYTYVAGSTTPQATYTTSAGNIQHANPIQLDAAGRVPGGEIWLTAGAAYKFVLETSASVLIGTYDNIVSYGDASVIRFVGFKGQIGVVEDLAGNTGADWIGFTQSGSNITPRSVQDKLRDAISVKDYGAKGDGITNDTTAIQNALNGAAGKTLIFPYGTYNIDNKLFVSSNTTIFGYGATLFCISSANVNTGLYITDSTYLVGVQNVVIYGLKIDGNRSLRSVPGAGALFYISSGQNHTLYDCIAVNSTIDGYQVTGDLTWSGGVNKNTRFFNCEAGNSYRNGLSVVGTDNFVDYCGKYHHSNGTNPQMGVDIEPNDANSRNYAFAFYSTHVYNNVRQGISVNGSSATNTTGVMYGVVSNDNSGYGFQSDQPSTDVRIYAPQANNNTDGNFDPTTYAFDADNPVTRTLSSARTRITGSASTSSGTWTDVTSATISYTPTYIDSFTRLRIKANCTVSGTNPIAGVRLINAGNSYVVDSVSAGIAGASRFDGTLFLAGQETTTNYPNLTYKLQYQITSGTGTIELSSIEMVAEEIDAG